MSRRTFENDIVVLYNCSIQHDFFRVKYDKGGPLEKFPRNKFT